MWSSLVSLATSDSKEHLAIVRAECTLGDRRGSIDTQHLWAITGLQLLEPPWLARLVNRLNLSKKVLNLFFKLTDLSRLFNTVHMHAMSSGMHLAEIAGTKQSGF